MAIFTPDAEFGIAKFCATCREAAFFRDDDETFEESSSDNGLPHLVFPQGHNKSAWRFVRTDTLPNLPRLNTSSHGGCDFCGFLRDIIRSSDTNDAAKAGFGNTLGSLGPSGISIYVCYLWKRGIDECRCDGMIGMLVRLVVEIEIEIEMPISLLCLAEGISGIDPSPLGIHYPRISTI